MPDAAANRGTDPGADTLAHAGASANPAADSDAHAATIAGTDPGADQATNARANAWAHCGTDNCPDAVSSVRAGAVLHQPGSGKAGARGGRPLPLVHSRSLEPRRLCCVPRLPAGHVR